MRAKTFWDKAKANYWAGREQDVYNIYDNATNMGNARSSYNRAATVAGVMRRQLEEGYKQDLATYKRKRAAEIDAWNRAHPPVAPEAPDPRKFATWGMTDSGPVSSQAAEAMMKNYYASKEYADYQKKWNKWDAENKAWLRKYGG